MHCSVDMGRQMQLSLSAATVLTLSLCSPLSVFEVNFGRIDISKSADPKMEKKKSKEKYQNFDKFYRPNFTEK